MSWRNGLIAAFVALPLMASCARTPPEQALREQLSQLQGDIDARDAKGVEAALAEDFVGNGGLDRQGARRLAAAMFLRYRDVGARLGPLAIEMRGDTHASVRFSAVVTGGAGGLLPQDGQVYQVTTGWRIAGKDWRMTSAEWTPQL